jgi:hypothetical protein
MTLEQRRTFIAAAERQRVTQMAKVFKVRPEPRANGRARTAMSMFGVSGAKADEVVLRGAWLPHRSPFPNRAEAHFAVAADFLVRAAIAITSADGAPHPIDFAIRTRASEEEPAYIETPVTLLRLRVRRRGRSARSSVKTQRPRDIEGRLAPYSCAAALFSCSCPFAWACSTAHRLIRLMHGRLRCP